MINFIKFVWVICSLGLAAQMANAYLEAGKTALEQRLEQIEMLDE